MMKNSLLILIGLCIFLSACVSGSSSRTGRASGPISANAKNRLLEKDPAALQRTAEGFERAGQCQAALSIYQQLLSADPYNKTAERGFARCLADLGRVAEAIRLLEKLNAENPLDSGARGDLVKIYLKTVQVVAARRVLEPIVGQGLASLVEQLQYGIILEIDGEAAKARTVFDGVQATAPNDHRAGRYLAYSFALDGNYDTAVALLQPLLDRPDTANEGREALSYIYALSGQYEAAIALAGGVLSPTDLDSRRTLLKILPRLQRADQAAAILLNKVSADALKRLDDGT